MSIKNNIKLIEELLSTLPQQNEKNVQLAAELGFLMGLLAKIANNDSYVYSVLKNELERRRKQ